jgi:hypothetical protein
MPRKGLTIVTYKPRKRANFKRRATKPKKTKISLFREWNVPDGAYRRYSGIKGCYWYWFSRTIRDRDYEMFKGKCMTCGEYVEREVSQCGHVFAAKDCGFTLLFHPLNNHLQHAKCNNPRFTPSAGIYNALTVNKRYGDTTIDDLIELKKAKGKEWSKQEYEDQIRKLPAYRKSLPSGGI